MKKKILSVVLAVCLCLGLLPAAAMAQEPAASSNANAQDYSTWSKPVKSYLCGNGQGLTRVEYIGGKVTVEDYSADFKLQNQRQLNAELPIFGGFYAGTTYNFLFFGQENGSQDNSREVIRTVKYSKSWERLGSVSLEGANTTVPFDAGSLRCDEYNGYLYVRTCHEMYKSDDGLNHQSNLTFCVQEENMSITDSFYSVMNTSYGYVSHSFNQFILVDSAGTLVAADHGDAYPRSIVLMTYPGNAGSGKFVPSGWSSSTKVKDMVTFSGQVGNNATGASLGGLAETSSGYVTVCNWTGGAVSGSTPRDVYLSYIGKDMGTPKSVKLPSSTGAKTPQLASMGQNGGYVLWSNGSGLSYASYDAQGNVGTVQSAQGKLSDCAPIAWNGSAVWYVTESGAPTFYTLNDSGVTAHPVGGGSGGDSPSTPSDSPSTPSDTPSTPSDSPSTPSDSPSTPSDTPSTPSDSPDPSGYAIPSVQTSQGSVLPEPQKAAPGETVTLTVLTKTGYHLDLLKLLDWDGHEITLTKVDSSHYTFTMPNSPVIMKTRFAAGSGDDEQSSPSTPSSSPAPSESSSPAPSTSPKPASGEKHQVKPVTVGGSKVTPQPQQAAAGETVTLTVSTASGEQLKTLSAKDGDGNTVTLQKQGEGKYIFTMPDSDVTLSATFFTDGSSTPLPGDDFPSGPDSPSSSTAFSDVEQGSFYYDAVQWAVQQGITTGTGGSSFSPGRTCTRQEIVTFLWRASGEPEPSGSMSFRDVPGDAYYAKAVQWAASEGITSGTGNGMFSPGKPCTRQETVTFLWRAVGSPEPAGEANFRDVQPGAFSYDAVCWAVENGVTSGTGGGMFSPNKDCTRGEIVTFLYRTYN